METSPIPGENVSRIMLTRIVLPMRHLDILNGISHMADENPAPMTPIVANSLEGHSTALFPTPPTEVRWEISFTLVAEIYCN